MPREIYDAVPAGSLPAHIIRRRLSPLGAGSLTKFPMSSSGPRATTSCTRWAHLSRQASLSLESVARPFSQEDIDHEAPLGPPLPPMPFRALLATPTLPPPPMPLSALLAQLMAHLMALASATPCRSIVAPSSPSPPLQALLTQLVAHLMASSPSPPTVPSLPPSPCHPRPYWCS